VTRSQFPTFSLEDKAVVEGSDTGRGGTRKWRDCYKKELA